MLPRWAWIVLAIVCCPTWVWVVLDEPAPRFIERFAYLSLTLVLGLQLVEGFLHARAEDQAASGEERPPG